MTFGGLFEIFCQNMSGDYILMSFISGKIFIFWLILGKNEAKKSDLLTLLGAALHP